MSPIDYIPYLRGMIGHEKCLSVGLTAMVFDQEGRVLFERRKDNGKYCFPGGSIDLNETVLEGLRREIREETGIEITNIRLFAIRSGEKCDFHYPNGDVTQYVDLYFLADVFESTDIKPQESETTSVFFSSLDSLFDEDSYVRGTYEILKKYLSGNMEVTID